eukprot:COSAG06_NODE_17795_length_921_cov_0.969586_2_plen_63_part_01
MAPWEVVYRTLLVLFGFSPILRSIDRLMVVMVAPVSYIILWLRLNAPFCATLIALGPVVVFQC